MSKDEKEIIIPEIIEDVDKKISYKKGRFFGKGGFAKCYEVINMRNKKVYAGKIVPKSVISKSNQREKMTQEISIHRKLNHEHIVGFHSFFDDSNNIYIILELCRRRSMMELHKRRKALTEVETRYYMKQILEGVSYLHQNKIIHRDLKLGNLFLDDDLQVKIGDFGLATQITHDGERKKTLCGTPNYIAPEILNKVGHSYEVDVWSIGCIMYTLLVGQPPFETSSLKETYSRIKMVQYKTPTNVSKPAMNMIMNILQRNPEKRPTIGLLLKDSWFSSGFLPASLPLSCLTMAPRLDMLESQSERKPLSTMNNDHDKQSRAPISSLPKDVLNANEDHNLFDIKRMLFTLKDQLAAVLKSKPLRENIVCADELTDPNSQPFVWISKWVDYSDKYGFGYQLSDDGIGVMFNDGTRLIILSNAYYIHYINREGTEVYYTVQEYPSKLEKKIRLMDFFKRYMNEHLMKAGGSVPIRQCDSMARIPYLYQWFRTQSAVIMHLTNGTVQVNFVDHTKIIMCPLMAAVTYIDEEKNFRTYRFQTIEKYGCCGGLFKSLQYAYEKLTLMTASVR